MALSVTGSPVRHGPAHARPTAPTYAGGDSVPTSQPPCSSGWGRGGGTRPGLASEQQAEVKGGSPGKPVLEGLPPPAPPLPPARKAEVVLEEEQPRCDQEGTWDG